MTRLAKQHNDFAPVGTGLYLVLDFKYYGETGIEQHQVVFEFHLPLRKNFQLALVVRGPLGVAVAQIGCFSLIQHVLLHN